MSSSRTSHDSATPWGSSSKPGTSNAPKSDEVDPSTSRSIAPPITVLSGHLGHLSTQQQEALESFRKSLTDGKLYTPALNGRHASHDDPTLLRFLRARRWDVPRAQKQFAEAEQWRAQHKVDALFANFPPDEFEESKKFYPRWTGRRDKHGLPLYVYRLASLQGERHKELNKVSPQRRFERIVALYEAMRLLVMPLCTHLPHATDTPVSSVTTIIDLAQVSIGAMFALRGHLQQASTMATANYPETLNTIAVVNSPAFFPTIWGWVKGWFDEGTRLKVHVLGKDPGPTLRALIDAKNLPVAYGGELEWTFDDEPALDEDARTALGGEMPKGPAIFIDGEMRRPDKVEESNKVDEVK